MLGSKRFWTSGPYRGEYLNRAGSTIWSVENAFLYDDFTPDEGVTSFDEEETFEDHTLNAQISASPDWTEVGSNTPDVQIRTGGVSSSRCARQITSLYGAYIWEEPGFVDAESFELWASFRGGLLGDITPLNWGLLFNWDPNAGTDYGEGYRLVVEDNTMYFVSYTAGVESAALDSDTATLSLNNSTTYVAYVHYTKSTGAMIGKVFTQAEWDANGSAGTALGTVSPTDSTYTQGRIGMQIYCFDQSMWVDNFNFESTGQRDIVPTEYSENWNAYTVDDSITDCGWTKECEKSGSPTFLVKSAGYGGGGDQCMRDDGQYAGYHSWDVVGEVDSSLVMEVKFTGVGLGIDGNFTVGWIFCWDPVGGSNRGDGYSVQVRENGNRLHIRQLDNDVFTDKAEASYTIADATWYTLRVYYNHVTGRIDGAVWKTDTETEDDATTVTWTDSSKTYTSGKVGMMVYTDVEDCKLDDHYVGIYGTPGLANPRTCDVAGQIWFSDEIPYDMWLYNSYLRLEKSATSYQGLADNSASSTNAGDAVFLVGLTDDTLDAGDTWLMGFSRSKDVSTTGDMDQCLSLGKVGLQYYLVGVHEDSLSGSGVVATPNYQRTNPGSVGIIKRSQGFYAVADGKLIWAGPGSDAAPDGLTPDLCEHGFIAAYHDTVDVAVDKMIGCPLADYNSAWGGDWTEVTDSKSAPASPQTFGCDNACHVRWTFTVEDTKVVYIRTRWGDADNCTLIQINGDRSVSQKKVVATSSTTFHQTAAAYLTDATSYQFDLVINSSDEMSLFIDGVLIGTGGYDVSDVPDATSGYIAHSLGTNDLEVESHPYPALGIATSRVICPQDDEVLTTEGDCRVEIKNIGTAAATAFYTWYFRHDTSTNDFIRLTIDNTDGSLSFREYNAGVAGDVLITAGAGSVSNGDTAVIVLNGANAEIFVNGASVGSSASASFENNTKLTLFNDAGWVCDHVACYPYDIATLLPEEFRP